MSAIFQEIECNIKDIGIIDKRIIVCYANQEPLIFEGKLQEIIFDSISWSTTAICFDVKNNSRYIYSMILNHRLYDQLFLMADKKRILTRRIES